MQYPTAFENGIAYAAQLRQSFDFHLALYSETPSRREVAEKLRKNVKETNRLADI